MKEAAGWGACHPEGTEPQRRWGGRPDSRRDITGRTADHATPRRSSASPQGGDRLHLQKCHLLEIAFLYVVFIDLHKYSKMLLHKRPKKCVFRFTQLPCADEGPSPAYRTLPLIA